jgi:hypothetical protein
LFDFLQSLDKAFDFRFGTAQNIKREPLRAFMSDAGQTFEFVN